MIENLSLYECEELINRIEAKAEENEGEISEEDMEDLVRAQTQSIDKLGKLVNYVKCLEGFCLISKAEIDRIVTKKKQAEKRIEWIKRFLVPYLLEKGPVFIGTHRLSLRKSEAIEVEDDFNNELYCRKEIVLKPDKKTIKESIKAGIEIEGAKLVTRMNTQIK